MKELKQKIKDCGLKQKFVAEKVGLSEAYFAMMINGQVDMPEQIRNSVNNLLQKIAV